MQSFFPNSFSQIGKDGKAARNAVLYRIETAKEAGFTVCMACRSGLFHLKKQRVGITVYGSRNDFLEMSRRFAFMPELDRKSVV